MSYQYPLAPRTSLRLGGQALDGFNLNTEAEVATVAQKAKKLNRRLMILGRGTNTVFTDNNHDILIGQMNIGGLSRVGNLIIAGGGVVWDTVVQFAIKHNLQGLEALTAIPGTAGAAPIQNIGAYGAELADRFHSLRAYDTKQQKFVELTKPDCAFGYRHSRFKEEPGRFIITQVTLALEPASANPLIPDYPSVYDYLAAQEIKNPTLSQISQMITNIRWSKLPKPEELPNAGSFFKNPVVSIEQADKLKLSYPNLPLFPLDKNKVKIPAGWLIEQAGLKGIREGGLGTYEKNALVIVNHGGGTYADLEALTGKIISAVRAKFDLTLKPEVNIIRQK
jgi:UDP-N-acetylmuramate dehydrogenase